MPNKHIKHTPWVFEHFDSQIGDTGDYSHCDRITGSNGKVIICDIWDGDEDSCAHAHLIAAAPELIQALRAVEHAATMGTGGYIGKDGQLIKTVRAAIAKAEGA